MYRTHVHQVISPLPHGKSSVIEGHLLWAPLKKLVLLVKRKARKCSCGELRKEKKSPGTFVEELQAASWVYLNHRNWLKGHLALWIEFQRLSLSHKMTFKAFKGNKRLGGNASMWKCETVTRLSSERTHCTFSRLSVYMLVRQSMAMSTPIT